MLEKNFYSVHDGEGQHNAEPTKDRAVTISS